MKFKIIIAILLMVLSGLGIILYYNKYSQLVSMLINIIIIIIVGAVICWIIESVMGAKEED